MPLPHNEWLTLICEASADRLDTFLASRLPEFSRSRIQRLISENNVRLNGENAKSSTALFPGDKVEIFVPPPKAVALEPEAIPLKILYDDADLAVIDKPAGLVVHPAAGHEAGTLVNALLHHFGAELAQGRGIGGELRPGIVHRIDRNTSGILLITKTESAHKHLSEQFQKHTITRRYQGLCWGLLPEDGCFDGPIARDPKERKRMAVIPTGRKALTKFKRLYSWDKAATMFEAELFTGRTHQIRVHFSHAGHPLAGDAVYSSATRSARIAKEAGMKILERKCLLAAKEVRLLQDNSRQFLHAIHLGFEHPRTMERMEFQSTLAEDLEKIAQSWESCGK